MKAYHLTSGCGLLLIALLAVQAPSTLAVFSMSETCSQISRGYIADPNDCQSYAFCSNGTLVGTRKCDNGLLYDARKGQCDYASKVKCSTRLDSTCSNIDSPIYVADPDDCTKACYCNGKGKYTCEECPKFQYFNPNTRACVWSKDYACPADSICRLVADNTFVGDPYVCGNYVSCFAGSGVSSSCGDDFWYNPTTGNCEAVDICQGSSTPAPEPGIGPGVETNLPKDTDACKAYTPNPDEEAQYFSDHKSCMGYHICTSAAGPGTWLKCPMGTHFDEKSQKCVTPYTFKCQYDRCGNINQQYVAKLGCDDYIFCANQTKVTQYSNSCASVSPNFPYFDEYLGSCVNEKPDYAICKP